MLAKHIGHERCSDLLTGYGGQVELVELVHVGARAVADVDHAGGHVRRRDRDDTLAGFDEGLVAVVPGADGARDQRWGVAHHHVEPVGHDVGDAAVSGGDQDDGAGFDQTVNLVQGVGLKILHGDHVCSWRRAIRAPASRPTHCLSHRVSVDNLTALKDALFLGAAGPASTRAHMLTSAATAR
jgi:hypothetical protein